MEDSLPMELFENIEDTSTPTEDITQEVAPAIETEVPAIETQETPVAPELHYAEQALQMAWGTSNPEEIVQKTIDTYVSQEEAKIYSTFEPAIQQEYNNLITVHSALTQEKQQLDTEYRKFEQAKAMGMLDPNQEAESLRVLSQWQGNLSQRFSQYENNKDIYNNYLATAKQTAEQKAYTLKQQLEIENIVVNTELNAYKMLNLENNGSFKQPLDFIKQMAQGTHPLVGQNINPMEVGNGYITNVIAPLYNAGYDAAIAAIQKQLDEANQAAQQTTTKQPIMQQVANTVAAKSQPVATKSVTNRLTSSAAKSSNHTPVAKSREADVLNSFFHEVQNGMIR